MKHSLLGFALAASLLMSGCGLLWSNLAKTSHNPNGTTSILGNEILVVPTLGVSGKLRVFIVNSSTGVFTEVANSPYSNGADFDTFAFDFQFGPSGTPSTYFVTSDQANGKTHSFSLDKTTGALSENAGSPIATVSYTNGAVFVDPLGRFAYTFNGSTTTIMGQSVSSTGAIANLAWSPAVAGATHYAETLSGQTAVFTNNGNFFYIGATNAAGTSFYVDAYSVTAGTGLLTPLATPSYAQIDHVQNLFLDPTGQYLFVVNTNSGPHIRSYAITAATGALSAVPISNIAIPNTTTAGFIFDSSGTHLYLAAAAVGNSYILAFNPSTGVLSAPTTTSSLFQAASNGNTDVTGQFVCGINNGSIDIASINNSTHDVAIVSSPASFGTNGTYCTFSRVGNFVYATDNSAVGNMVAYHYDPVTGATTLLQTLPLGDFPMQIYRMNTGL